MNSGFVRYRNGTAESIDSINVIGQAYANAETTFWANSEEPSALDISDLNDLLGLDEASLEDCLHGEQRPRIDEFEKYIFLVLYGLAGLDDPSEFNPRKLASFCNSSYFITVHREPLRTLRTNIDHGSRYIVSALARGEYDNISDSLEWRFSHVRDHSTQVIDLVDTLRERLQSIRDNYHTALAERTNAIMRTLTRFAMVMLPLTFLTGVYGMNLPLWSSPEYPHSFWIVVGGMLTLAVGLVLYFRRNNGLIEPYTLFVE